jgi:chemotaxis protein CheY-P-specific phosphatase CheC
MLDDATREKAGEVFCEILEKMAFMFGDPVAADDLPASSGKYHRTFMMFRGAMSGSMAMAVPVEMCAEVAANVLGVELDSELAEEQSCDALKELLNVACGNILTAIAGDEPVFDLQPPDIETIESAAWHAMLNDPNTLVFNVDENPVLLNLTFKSGKA